MFLYVFHVFFLFSDKTCFKCLFLILKSMFFLHLRYAIRLITMINKDSEWDADSVPFVQPVLPTASRVRRTEMESATLASASPVITSTLEKPACVSCRCSPTVVLTLAFRLASGKFDVDKTELIDVAKVTDESSHGRPSTWVGSWAPSVSRMN